MIKMIPPSGRSYELPFRSLEGIFSGVHYSETTPNHYYPKVIYDIMEYGETIHPRNTTTKELHPTTAIIANPTQHFISSFGRVINLPFILAETIQILAGENDAQALKFYNSKIIDIQGDHPNTLGFNAAYGPRLKHFDGVDQVNHVIQTLTKDFDSRQASIVLSHPVYDNYKRVTKDRACNVYAHVMIRNEQLDWMQIVRSNDAIWGVPYNFVQWTTLQEFIADALKVRVGNHFLVQDSLHIYDKHFEEARNIKYFDMYEYIPASELLSVTFVDTYGLLKSEWEIRVRNAVTYPKYALTYWENVLCVFYSYKLFKEGKDYLAWQNMPLYKELRWPLMRNYFIWRWGKEGNLSLGMNVYEELEGIFGKENTKAWLQIGNKSL
jgi:thymidylate synthase